MKLSIVIPVYNEKNTLKDIIMRVKEAPVEDKEIVEDELEKMGDIEQEENIDEVQDVQEDVTGEEQSSSKSEKKKSSSGTILKAVGATMAIGSAVGAGVYYKKEKDKEEEESENEDDEFSLESEDDLVGGEIDV